MMVDGDTPDEAVRLHRIEVDFPMSLWLVDLTIGPHAEEIGWLGRAEVDRAMRFRNIRDQSRYLAAHIGLRLAVEQERAMPPSRQLYDRDPMGRWRLINGSGLKLSFSYADSVALIGLKQGAMVGVDIVNPRLIDDVEQLGAVCFDADEQSALAATPDDGRSRAFLHGWARKEAALKAIGTGFQRSPETVHTGLAGRCCVWTECDRIEIASFETAGLIGAVAQVLRH